MGTKWSEASKQAHLIKKMAFCKKINEKARTL